MSDTLDVVISDTVGFIRKLPHQLVEAFKATLEELEYADLLLHVIDISDPHWLEQAQIVDELIEELGAQQIPCLRVYNKSDLYFGDIRPHGEDSVNISAKTGEGVDELLARIDEMKKKYYDARHNCWCFVLHDGTVRYGDDGEPQGTAGQPMLNVFQRENVENVVCIVTRYFGGILLGAGGLTRAYAKAAKDALDNAGKARMQPFSVLLLECPYPMFERIKLLIEGHEGRIESSDYGAAVTLTFLLPVQKTADFSAALTELSGGQMSAEEVEQRFLPGARE